MTCNAGEGVCVQASTLGSLEALLEFLKSPAVKIPVSGINIGPVHKKDIMRASVMLEKGRQKFACLLAFDVPVTKEAREMAESLGVKVFTADIIYHLFDQFTAYLKTVCKPLLLYQDKCYGYVTSPCLPPLPLPPSPLSLAHSQGFAITLCGTGYADCVDSASAAAAPCSLERDTACVWKGKCSKSPREDFSWNVVSAFYELCSR